MEKVIPNCANCFFKSGEAKQIVCRRNPPQLFLVPHANPLSPNDVQMGLQSFFPPCGEGMWCGEYMPEVPDDEHADKPCPCIQAGVASADCILCGGSGVI